MSKFTPVGRIEKDHAALRVDLDGGYPLGRLVVAADDVSKLIRGREVDIHFVQERPGCEPFIGFAGIARLSASGKAVTFRLEGRILSIPVRALESVISGKRQTARISSPIVDADRVQREAIDQDLVRSFS